MLLGDLLGRFRDDASAAEALLALGDLRLVAAVRGHAAAEGLEPGAFVARAVRRYAEGASDDEWITLLGTLARSADPALTFIKRAVSAETS